MKCRNGAVSLVDQFDSLPELRLRGIGELSNEGRFALLQHCSHFVSDSTEFLLISRALGPLV